VQSTDVTVVENTMVSSASGLQVDIAPKLLDSLVVRQVYVIEVVKKGESDVFVLTCRDALNEHFITDPDDVKSHEPMVDVIVW